MIHQIIHQIILRETLFTNSVATPYNKNSLEQKELNQSLIQLIIGLNLPLKTVDETLFKDFVHKLNKTRYKIPGRTFVTHTLINDKFLQLKLDLYDKLSQIEYCSLTCDGWTSTSNQSYLGKIYLIIFR